jgi:hypothetical protein
LATAAVQESVPVPLLFGVNVTPVGRVAVSLSVGSGKPVAVTVKDPAVPTVKLVLLALVITGAPSIVMFRFAVAV